MNLEKDWEDYEEPKDDAMRVIDDFIQYVEEEDDLFRYDESVQKFIDKLKAWRKLMDYWGTEILGWEIRDMPTGGNWQTVNVKFNIRARKEPTELMDLLFGDEK